MGIKIEDIKKQGAAPNKKDNEAFAWLMRDISPSGNKLKMKEKEQFFSEFSVLMTAGLDLRNALEIMQSSKLSKKQETALKTVYASVMQGGNLSAAMRGSGFFAPYDEQNVAIGEKTGRLPEILARLQAYYGDKLKQRRQISSAVSYPVLILAVAVAALVFMFNFLVPMFVQVFDRFGGELPQITQLVISISYFMGDNMPWFVFFTVALITTFVTLRKKYWFRKYLHFFLLKLPLFGPFLQAVHSQQVYASLSLLFAAKVSLTEALSSVAKMTRFVPYQEMLQDVEERIMQGEKLHASMAEYPLFPKKDLALVKVGEEVNRLEFVFEKLHAQLSEELKNRIATMNTVLEPALIVFVGILVGFILVAMYLPMFQMSTQVY